MFRLRNLAIAVLMVLTSMLTWHAYRDHAMLHRLLVNDVKFLHWAEGIECDVRHTCGK